MSSAKPEIRVIAMASAAILDGRPDGRLAQNAPAPRRPASPASALDNLPHQDITNGIISAKVYLPGENGFYRGTRFDRAGVVAHATYKGHDYGQYWFSSYSPDVHDFSGRMARSPSPPPAARPARPRNSPPSASTKPAMGGKFLKIGVGILKRDTADYDFVHAYPVVNEGKRGFSATKTSVRLTQDLADKDTG